MNWGRRFLTQWARWGSRPRADIEEFQPIVGVRFIGAHDTTDFLIDLAHSSRGRAVVEGHWGRVADGLSRRGWLPIRWDSERNADSLIAKPELFAPSMIE
jgi:hypothetical protein